MTGTDKGGVVLCDGPQALFKEIFIHDLQR